MQKLAKEGLLLNTSGLAYLGALSNRKNNQEADYADYKGQIFIQFVHFNICGLMNVITKNKAFMLHLLFI